MMTLFSSYINHILFIKISFSRPHLYNSDDNLIFLAKIPIR